MEPREVVQAGSPIDQPALSKDGRPQRLKAICVIKHNADYLFSVGTDPKGPRTFLVPVGGGIEFGELAADAVVREVQEEIGVDIETPRLVGVLENNFTWNGADYHEIVFCFVDEIPSRDVVPSTGRESNGESFPLRWLSEEELRSSPVPVYPDGILALILEEASG